MGERRAEVVAGRARVASRSVRVAAVVSIMVIASSVSLSAQNRCRVLCAPELKIEPTFTVENLFRPAVIETLDEHGVVVERSREKRANGCSS